MSRIHLRNRKGSLTVEACVMLPAFMFVVLTIAFFTRVVFIQNAVQTSLNQTALELSNYSYILQASGLMEVNHVTTGNLQEIQGRAFDKTGNVINSLDALKKSYENIQKEQVKDASKGEDFLDLENKIDGFTQLYQDASASGAEIRSVITDIKANPKKELGSILAYISNYGFEKFKTYDGGEVAKYIMGKSINKRIFKKVNVGAYIEASTNQEMDSFNFEKSSIFKDNKTIDLVARYTVKINLPINILPEIKIEQRATVAGWLRGDASWDKVELEYSSDNKNKSSEIDKNLKYWELSALERGRIISQEELVKLGNQKPEEVTEVRSINLKNKSYEKDAAVLSSIRRDLVKLQEKTKNNGTKITRRNYLLILPESSIESDKLRVEALLEKIRVEALEKEIVFQYREGYGKS